MILTNSHLIPPRERTIQAQDQRSSISIAAHYSPCSLAADERRNSCFSADGPGRDPELPERRQERDGGLPVYSQQRRTSLGEQTDDAAGSL